MVSTSCLFVGRLLRQGGLFWPVLSWVTLLAVLELLCLTLLGQPLCFSKL
jgi:hypothetical protein